MQVIHYPHPTLRRVAKPLRKVDAQLRTMVAEMFELMYAHRGCGLAGNQVDLPYRLFVMNVSGDAQLKDQELVFLNPVVSRPKGNSEMEEGCLSLPGLYGKVRRPAEVHITGYDLFGNEQSFAASDMFARVVQHEVDHLDGVLFIDRVSETGQIAMQEALEEFAIEFDQRRSRGEIPDMAAIEQRWAELETQRT